MQRNSLKDYHHYLTWESKIYTVLVLLVGITAIMTNALHSGFALAMLVALIGVLVIETFTLVAPKHTPFWMVVKWVVLLLFLGLVLAASL
jgi:hypothetical protein